MSAHKITVDTEKAIRLTYKESDYPGWKLSSVAPNPLTGPDGTEYHFTAMAIVEKITHRAGIEVSVLIAHYPNFPVEPANLK